MSIEHYINFVNLIFLLLVLVFPVWSLPIYLLLKRCFKPLKGTLVVVALSLPSLIICAYLILGINPYLPPPGLSRIAGLVQDAPFLLANAVVALLCVGQLIFVGTGRLKDPPPL